MTSLSCDVAFLCGTADRQPLLHHHLGINQHLLGGKREEAAVRAREGIVYLNDESATEVNKNNYN